MEGSEQKRMVLRRTRQERSREEKAGFVFVIVTGSLAVLLGGFYLARHVGEPLDVSYVGPQFFTSQQQEAQELEAQKTTDTDGDRIADYDELYVLKTSPYLSDTDGDGIDDYAEVQVGTDPTCIEGADCSQSQYVNPNAELEGNFFEIDELLQDPNEDAPRDVNEIVDTVSALTPDQIRDLLIASGADPAQVAQLTDAEVQALYESVLKELEESGELQNMNPQETP